MLRSFSLRTFFFIAVSVLSVVSVRTAEAVEKPIDRIVTLKDGSEVVATIEGPSSATNEIFVLLNGLVYETHRWNTVAKLLASKGHTVIRYSYSGQPANLRRLTPGTKPAFFETGLDPQRLSDELSSVLTELGVERKIQLVALSYGSSVASAFVQRHPDRVDQLIYLAPLVVPTDSYDPRSAGLRNWLEAVRFWENAPCSYYGAFNPSLCTQRDFWYDTFYKSLYGTYLEAKAMKIPAGVDSSVYKKSLYHLVRAARDFDLHDSIVEFRNVSLFVASDDDASLKQDQERAWDLINPSERRSFVTFTGAHHALPDEAPARVVEALMNIVKGDEKFREGRRFEVPADR